MEKIGNIQKSISREKTQKALADWQVWALEFCKKYEIPKESLGVIMKTAKGYSDSLDYLRGIDGFISDYPSLPNGQAVLKIFLWKLKKDRQDSIKSHMVKRLYM